MTFIPSTDMARVMPRYVINSTEAWSFTLHFTKNGFTDADLLDLAEIVDGEIPTLLAQQTSSGGYLKTDAYDIRTVGGTVLSVNANAGNGDIVDEPLAAALAIVLTLRTATRGRSGRGRLFIGGWGETNFNSNNFAAAARTAVTTFATDLKAGALAAGWTWVVRSQQQNNAAINPAIGRPITSFEIRNYEAGIQRRRIDRG